MTTVNQYKLFCITESAWVTVWLTVTPTVCPNNLIHSINSSSIAIIDKVSANSVEIKQETTNTGAHFKCETRIINAVANITTTLDYTNPVAISPLSMCFVSTSVHEGDELEVQVGPDTTVGNITANVAIGASNITVSQSVIDIAQIGYYAKLADGTNTDNLGRIIAINKQTLVITIETVTTHAFLVVTPTLVKMTVKPVENFEIGSAGKYLVGVSTIKASYVPANTIVRYLYNNKSLLTAKKLVIKVEYLY